MERQTTATLLEEQEEKLSDQNTATAATADKLFAKALTNLSFHDRTTIEDEIHGVSCIAVEETPDLLESSLIHFELELHRIDSKPAYDKAQELLLLSSNPFSICCYINDNNFRLRFLRCELFDVRKAVERYIKYLDFVAEVYGEYALQRPIRMSDLTNEEIKFLRTGKTQLLPYPDRCGRRIIVFPSTNQLDEVPKKSMLKVGFYILNACVGGCDTTNNDFNNIECHRKGLIIISFVHLNSDTVSKFNLKLIKDKLSAQMMIAQAIPIRMVGNHVCYPNTQAYRVRGKVVGMANSVWNSRTKIHLGNPIEWRYALQGYGIPTEIIPSTDTGTIKLDNWKKWIKLKTYSEQLYISRSESGRDDGSDSTSGSVSTTLASTSTIKPMNSIVECPGSHDVIFRKGKTMMYHPGNVLFQNIIESRIQEHSIDPKTTYARRQAIEMEVIQQIKNDCGRFLKWEIDKGWWSNMSLDIDIDMDSTNGDRSSSINSVILNANSARCIEADKEIQTKVHYAFRDFKKKMMKPQQNVQLNTSSTYAFERQDGQKRKRSSKNSCSSADSGSMITSFLPNTNENVCGYFFSTADDSSSNNNFAA